MSPGSSSNDVANLDCGYAESFTQRPSGDPVCREFANLLDGILGEFRTSNPLASGRSVGLSVATVVCSSRRVGGTGAVDQFWIQMGPVPVTRRGSAFGSSIEGVVQWCAQKQVPVTYAQGGVTAMQNPQIVGRFPVLQFPGDAVCADVVTSDPKNAVAVAADLVSPQPAAAVLGQWSILVDLGPEADWDGCRGSAHTMFVDLIHFGMQS